MAPHRHRRRPSPGLLWKRFGGRWSHLALVVALAFAVGLTELVTISFAVLTLGSLVFPASEGAADRFLGFELPPVQHAVAIGLGLVALRWLLATLADWISQTLVMRSVLALRTELLESFLGASWDLQAAERSGSVHERLFQNATQVGQMLRLSLGWLQAAVALSAVLVGALTISPLAAGAAFVAASVLMLAARPLSRRAMQSARAGVAAGLQAATVVRSFLDAVLELTVFGALPAALREMARQMEAHEGRRRLTHLWGNASSQLYFTLVLTGGWIAVGALHFLDSDQFTGIGIVALLLLRSIGYTRTLQVAAVNIRNLEPVFDDLLLFQSRMTGDAEQRWGSQKPEQWELEVEEVGYRYPDAARPALDGVRLVVPAGGICAIVGRSGSGKTTLAQLVLGLRTPDRGRILIGGVPQREIDRRWWQANVAVVTQEAQLLDATLLENVVFYRDHVSTSAALDAVRAVGLADWIEELPEGIATRVGERGSELSGGQRQRLCIARALAGRPRLMVLDEPTSALDPVSERVVRECIGSLRGECTTLIIAHRQSTVELCDQVAVLEGGRLVRCEPGAGRRSPQRRSGQANDRLVPGEDCGGGAPG
ncbi:MAG: ABC transporter ATP-binding protein [Acidobacteria bacterium]|nr:MAG: ABC transporter ATP-binding protein [Acidobacteriota bacterium]